MALESEATALERGDAAPDFELMGTDGESYGLASFAQDEALLVVFTCNHCPYARAKFGAMNDIAHAYDEVSVIGINPNDEEEYPEDSLDKMVDYVESGEVDFDAYLRDSTQEVAERYGAVCTPDPFLFRNDGGTFRLAYHGRFDDALNPDEEPAGEAGFEMRAAIDAVLAGDEPDEPFRPSRGCSIKWR